MEIIFRGKFRFRKFKFEFEEFISFDLLKHTLFPLFPLNEKNYEFLVSSLKKDALF